MGLKLGPVLDIRDFALSTSMVTDTSVHRHRFIAYALIGYLDFVRRTHEGDINYNYSIGPRFPVEDLMREVAARAELVELFELIYELEALIRLADPKTFEHAVSEALKPVIAWLQEDAPSADGELSPIELLLCSPPKLRE